MTFNQEPIENPTDTPETDGELTQEIVDDILHITNEIKQARRRQNAIPHTTIPMRYLGIPSQSGIEEREQAYMRNRFIYDEVGRQLGTKHRKKLSRYPIPVVRPAVETVENEENGISKKSWSQRIGNYGYLSYYVRFDDKQIPMDFWAEFEFPPAAVKQDRLHNKEP